MQNVRPEGLNFKGFKKASFILATFAILAFSPNGLNAQTAKPKKGNEITMEKVSFNNRVGIKIVGNIHYPKDFDKSKTYSAIITVPPAGGAKEQAAGLYASKMAENGFIAIAIDASFQGESGGEPRYREDPYIRAEDIRGTVDYLVTLPYIDDNRVGVLGICAGGGYAANAAMTERRIKAVGVAVPVNGGREMRAGGSGPTIETLETVANQRTAEARGAEPMLVPFMPDEYKDAEDIDLREGYQYYRTARNPFPEWANKMRFISMDTVMSFDAFYLSEMLLTQPLQVIIGSKSGSFGSDKDGRELYNRSPSTVKDLKIMEGASHFDLYDNPKYVDNAVKIFTDFYRSNLK